MIEKTAGENKINQLLIVSIFLFSKAIEHSIKSSINWVNNRLSLHILSMKKTQQQYKWTV